MANVTFQIFVVTTGGVLPFIDRVGRRTLMIYGAIICCVLHFISGALMASYGHSVPDIDGNTILTWQITDTAAAKGIIASKSP